MLKGQRSRRLQAIVVLVSALLVWPLARDIADLGAAQVPPARDGALRIVRAVRAAQETYRSVHGYYDRLECLVQDGCVPNPYPPTYLAAEAARASAHGYSFRMSEGPRAQSGLDEFISPTGMTAYAMTATPSPGVQAVEPSASFCGDADGIFQYADGRPPAVHAGRCLHRSSPVF